MYLDCLFLTLLAVAVDGRFTQNGGKNRIPSKFGEFSQFLYISAIFLSFLLIITLSKMITLKQLLHLLNAKIKFEFEVFRA